MSPFDHITYWHWWIVAGTLLVIGLTTPSFYFLWLSAAAAAIGVLLFFIPLGFIYQLVLFVALAALIIGIARFYFKTPPVA
ncbi:MAG: NfeD family protein [Gammaproteobacteria bacterium]